MAPNLFSERNTGSMKTGYSERQKQWSRKGDRHRSVRIRPWPPSSICHNIPSNDLSVVSHTQYDERMIKPETVLKGKTAKKERIDRLLMERRLVQSREKARAFIMEGKVLVDGAMIDKPGVKVDLEANIRLQEEDPLYVSRGGKKLKGAIEAFGIDPTGMVVMDVGASTGGFTDCILQEGARKVYAVDVGYGRLAWKFQKDQRGVSLEGKNIRYLKREEGDEEMALITIA